MKKNFLLLIAALLTLQLLAQNKKIFTVKANTITSTVAPTMWGIFFEDINMGADGGIYAELIKNRSFEFTKALMGWTVTSTQSIQGFYLGSEITVVNQPDKALTNPRYIHVALNQHQKGSLGVTNEGFRGMGIKKGLRYDFSISYRQQTAQIKLHLELISEKGTVIASTVFLPAKKGAGWQNGTTSFIANETDSKAKFRIWFEGDGSIDLDMISLFPSDTWKGRKGGMRADMVEALAAMKPGFIRFPGGCIVEGHDLSTRYQWKKTVGPVEERKLIINRWNSEFAHRPAPDYFQTFGLGFYEYFQLAEDIGAAALPILNCGMSCQFNAAETVPLEALDNYIQDALDLIEFANGDSTSTWGKVRAQMGHPLPFNLTMLGVGNENWGTQYIERFQLFQAALQKKYPAIKLVGSTGFMPMGDVFDYLNKSLRNMQVSFVDEHFYNRPEWFFANATRYDSYDRNSTTKVFAGEYAGQSDRMVSPENKNNWLTALSEAAFLTGIERNAAVVNMASYAPLFAHIDGWQWTPNLIWVDNLNVMPTPNYYVQQAFATNKGTHVVPITYKNNQPATGQDSLYASAVIDKINNTLIIKLVNAAPQPQQILLNVEGLKKKPTTAISTVLQSSNLETVNTIAAPPALHPLTETLALQKNNTTVTLKPYSFTVIKIQQ